MTAIIEIKDLTWQYLNTTKPAIQKVCLTVNEGDFVGIIGQNGAGKTTLAYCIDGLVPGQYHGIKHGSVLVSGKEVEEYGKGELQQMVGMVFSDPEAQFTSMTVEDELVFGMENLGMTIPEIRERLDWVTQLTDLSHLLMKPPYEISGGQKQRVALAAVLAMTPRIMILDEPTSMLDPISRKRVFDVLYKLKEEKNITIIVIEHSLENLIPLADRMVLLHDGEIKHENATRPFFQEMDLLLANGVFPPGVTHFFHHLTKAGVYHGLPPLTISEASESLRNILTSSSRA